MDRNGPRRRRALQGWSRTSNDPPEDSHGPHHPLLECSGDVNLGLSVSGPPITVASTSGPYALAQAISSSQAEVGVKDSGHGRALRRPFHESRRPARPVSRASGARDSNPRDRRSSRDSRALPPVGECVFEKARSADGEHLACTRGRGPRQPPRRAGRARRRRGGTGGRAARGSIARRRSRRSPRTTFPAGEPGGPPRRRGSRGPRRDRARRLRTTRRVRSNRRPWPHCTGEQVNPPGCRPGA